MRYKILIFLGVLLLPLAFIANRSNAEDIEELNLRSVYKRSGTSKSVYKYECW